MKRYILLILIALCFLAFNSKETNISDLYLKNQKVFEAKAEFNRYLKHEFLQGDWKKLLINNKYTMSTDFLNENTIKELNYQLIPTLRINSTRIIEYKNQKNFIKCTEPDSIFARCHLSFKNRVVGIAFLQYGLNAWKVDDLRTFTIQSADFFNNKSEGVFFIGVKNQGVLYSHCFYFENNKCFSVNTFSGEKIEFVKFLNTGYGRILKMGIDNLSE